MPSDAATYLDPFIFCFGFFACAAAIMLSQMHRDERLLLSLRAGLPFNLMRKVLAVALLVAVVLGFWIVGLWWPLLAVVLAIGAWLPVMILRDSTRRLSAIFALAFVG